jgi:hypothetical protein
MIRNRSRFLRWVGFLCLLVQFCFLGANLLHLALPEPQERPHRMHRAGACPAFDHSHVTGHVAEDRPSSAISPVAIHVSALQHLARCALVIPAKAGIQNAWLHHGPSRLSGLPDIMPSQVQDRGHLHWRGSGTGHPCRTEHCVLCSLAELLRASLQIQPSDLAKVPRLLRPSDPEGPIPASSLLRRSYLPRGPPIIA